MEIKDWMIKTQNVNIYYINKKEETEQDKTMKYKDKSEKETVRRKVQVTTTIHESFLLIVRICQETGEFFLFWIRHKQ